MNVSTSTDLQADTSVLELVINFTVKHFISPLSHYINWFQSLGFALSLVGLVLNYIIYRVSRSVPNPSSYFKWMCHLSISDTLALINCGVFLMNFHSLTFLPRLVNSFLCKAFAYEWWACGLEDELSF